MLQPLNILQFTGNLLLQLQRNSGFKLHVSDYSDAFELAKKCSSTNDLKFQLSAIICTTPQQQQQFYNLFDEVLDKHLQAMPPKPLKQKAIEFICDYKWILSATMVVVCIVVFILYNTSPTLLKLPASPKPQYALLIDNITSADSDDSSTHSFSILITDSANNSKDISSQFSLQWHLDNGDTSSKTSFSKTINDLKLHTCTLHLSSSIYNVDTTIYHSFESSPKYSILETVIPNRPQLQGNTCYVGDTIHVEFYTNDIFKDSTEIINESEPEKKIEARGTQTNYYNFITTKAGTQKFTYHVNKVYQHIADSTFGKTPEQTIFNVLPQQQLTINALEKPTTINYQIKWLWLLLFVIIGLLVWFIISVLAQIFLYLQGKKKTTITQKIIEKNYQEKLTTLKNIFKGSEKPYQTKFNAADGFIQSSPFIQELKTGLQQKIETQRQEINIAKTITATSKNYGIITPITQFSRTQKSYVVLIHSKYSHSTQYKLFAYLLQSFSNQSIAIKTATLFNSDHIEIDNRVTTLEEIIAQNNSSPLLIFSDGYLFVDDNNVLQASFATAINKTENKVLITPTPFADWGIEEKILQQQLPVVPADVSGLLDVIAILNNQEGLKQYKTYSSQYLNFYSVDEIKYYLDDDDLFQWICALATYPKLSWELIIAIGNELYTDKNEIICYENLLKLVRISWLHEASFPVDVRLGLLKELDRNNELKIREYLLKILKQQLKGLNTYSLAYEEVQVQIFTNSFIIKSSSFDDRSELNEDVENYVTLYKSSNITDTACKVYLENKKAAWDNTLIGKEKQMHNVQLSQVIEIHEEKKLVDLQKKITKPLVKEFAKQSWTSVLGLLIIFIVYCFITPTNAGKFLHHFNATSADTLRNNEISFSALTDTCLKQKDTSQKVQWLFTYNDIDDVKNNKIDSISLTTDSLFCYTNKLQTNTLYSLLLKTSTGSYNGNVLIDSNKNYNIKLISGCGFIDSTTSTGDTVYIQYNDPSQKDYANGLAVQLKQPAYSVAEVKQLAFDGGNEIRYYNDNKLTNATELQKQTASYFSNIPNANFNLKKLQLSLPEKEKNILKVWIKNIPNKIGVPCEIHYCPSSEKQKAEDFSRLLNGARYFYNEATKQDCKGKTTGVYYYYDTQYNKAIELAKQASVFFNKEIKVQPKATNQQRRGKIDRLELWINDRVIKPACISNFTNGVCTIYFEDDRYSINEKSRPVLDEFINDLRHKSVRIFLNSYASTGSSAFSLSLSQRLAQSLNSYLLKNGISASAISSRSFGKQGLNTTDCANKVVLTTKSNNFKLNIHLQQNATNDNAINSGYFKSGIEESKKQILKSLEIMDIEINFISDLNYKSPKNTVQYHDKYFSKDAGLIAKIIDPKYKTQFSNDPKKYNTFDVWTEYYAIDDTVQVTKKQILWLSDNPPSAKDNLIPYFQKNHIEVITATTNEDAYKKLKTSSYDLVITDIRRNKDENGVKDKDRAGIEFIEQTSFSKSKIIVYSPKDLITLNGGELAVIGIDNAHIISDKEPEILKQIVLKLTSAKPKDKPKY